MGRDGAFADAAFLFAKWCICFNSEMKVVEDAPQRFTPRQEQVGLTKRILSEPPLPWKPSVGTGRRRSSILFVPSCFLDPEMGGFPSLMLLGWNSHSRETESSNTKPQMTGRVNYRKYRRKGGSQIGYAQQFIITRFSRAKKANRANVITIQRGSWASGLPRWSSPQPPGL